MIYFFSLYVLKNFCDFPSRYQLYVSCIIAMLNFLCFDELLSLPLSFAHLSIWWRLSLFNFASRCGRRFPFLFRSFLRSFRECKGKNLFCIPKFYFLFFWVPLFAVSFVFYNTFFRRLRAAKVGIISIIVKCYFHFFWFYFILLKYVKKQRLLIKRIQM